MWAMIAATGLGALGSQTQQTAAIREQNRRNEAILDANSRNLAMARFKTGLNSIQQALAQRQVAGDQARLRTQGLQALGTVNANAAAAGTVGASVNAVAADVARSVGEAQAELDADYAITEFNFNTQLHDLWANTEAGLRSTERSADTGGFTGSLLRAGLQMGADYAMRRMDLGLGESANSGTPAPKSQNLWGGLAQLFNTKS